MADTIRPVREEQTLLLTAIKPASKTEHVKHGKGADQDALTSYQDLLSEESSKSFSLGAPRLQAPEASPKANPDNALSYLVNAFAGTFDAMAAGTEQEVGSLGQMQTLDQTMSQLVVDSTNNAINKQLAALDLTNKINSQIQAIQDQANGVDKFMTWIGFGLVFLVTVLASIPTDGASDAALPEEAADASGDAAAVDVGGGSMTISQAEAAVNEIGIDAASDVASDSGVEAENAGDAKGLQNAANDAKVTPKMKSNVLQDIFKKTGLSPDRAEQATRWFKTAMSITGSAMCAVPMGLQGYASIQVGQYQEQLAGIQLDAGTASAAMQGNSMEFQFCQQLNKREGDVVQTLVEETGDVVTLIGGIMSGYGQIPSILAQAV